MTEKRTHVRRTIQQIWADLHVPRFLISFIVGLIVLGLMRLPVVEASFVGEPDREMRDTAFKIRADTIGGTADPVLFLDIDDETLGSARPAPPGFPRAPDAITPREVIARLILWMSLAPPAQRPKAIIVDVDLATPTPGYPEGTNALRDSLSRWAADPTLPTLILVREAFPGGAIGWKNDDLILPVTEYDDIVGPARNIFWSGVKVLADKDNVVREFQPYQCVLGPNGVQPIFHAALLAYGAMGEIPKDAPVRKWLEEGATACKDAHPRGWAHGELINFHMSLQRFDTSRVWPDVDPAWPGFARCGKSGDSAIFRQISAFAVAAAAEDAGHDLLCQRLVIIGGTNTVSNDYQDTALDDMSGPMIIANSVRGLQMSGGGMHSAPWWVQISVIFVASFAIGSGFAWSARVREHWLKLKNKRHEMPLYQRILIVPLNPVILQWGFAFAAHWIGVLILLWALKLGYWGYLSAPAFAAAVTGAIQEFADEDS